MAVSDARLPGRGHHPSSTAEKPPNKFRQAFPQYAAVSPFFILFAIFGAFPVLLLDLAVVPLLGRHRRR